MLPEIKYQGTTLETERYVALQEKLEAERQKHALDGETFFCNFSETRTKGNQSGDTLAQKLYFLQHEYGDHLDFRVDNQHIVSTDDQGDGVLTRTPQELNKFLGLRPNVKHFAIYSKPIKP